MCPQRTGYNLEICFSKLFTKNLIKNIFAVVLVVVGCIIYLISCEIVCNQETSCLFIKDLHKQRRNRKKIQKETTMKG